MTKCLLFT